MESTLSLKKSDYESKLGLILGWGLGADGGDPAWNTRQAYIIHDCVESGLRRVYHCGYNWSWLKPWISLSLASAGTTIELPDDFGGLEGSLAVADSLATPFQPLRVVNSGMIEQLYAADPTGTGRPKFASMRLKKGPGHEEGQRSEIYLYPIADQAYTLRMQYYILPNKLDGTHKYAYGGSAMTELVLESCMAIKEERYDNVMNGPHTNAYNQQLQRAIRMDSRSKAQYYGENTDGSDDLYPKKFLEFPPFTINGVDES